MLYHDFLLRNIIFYLLRTFVSAWFLIAVLCFVIDLRESIIYILFNYFILIKFVSGVCARVRHMHRHIHILHYFLEIRIAFKFCAEMARAIVKFRLIKKKCRSYTVLSRDPEAIRGKERESAEIYITVMIRSLLPRHITVPFANGFPLLISSPLAREEHSFARSLFSYPPRR